MRIRLGMTLFLACLAPSPSVYAGSGNNYDSDGIDSIGLSLSLPFGGDRAGEHWLDRAESSLNLGMTHYEASNGYPCEDSCQQRLFTPRAYSLSLTGLVEAAGMLVGPPQDLRLQLGRWHDLLIDSDPQIIQR
ncbi:MAG: hypothetical protein JWQ90_2289 [Hydrocarboniphaga sp.]|uniref:hypothetical protein n=1 Tax=Hydrocarboniphaga sp. TaxID=2033016 RepID=UPI002612C7E7|nr:hypothetical protein [Hydrocarboniphaga sp.]MDB5969839.1 hypothetical protein [Hydrocarboniphaga sp.]